MPQYYTIVRSQHSSTLVLYYTMLIVYYTLYSTILCYTILYSTLLYYTILL